MRYTNQTWTWGIVEFKLGALDGIYKAHVLNFGASTIKNTKKYTQNTSRYDWVYGGGRQK